MIGSLVLPPSLIEGIYVFFVAIGISGIVALNWEWIIKKFAQKKEKEIQLRSIIEDAYIRCRNVCEPDTLNPDKPGNANFIKADARDYINPIRHILIEAGLGPPLKCTTEKESLDEWFRFLEHVRSSKRWIDLVRM